MWIKLTVCGVTRLGYGHAGDKEGGDAIKEIIGDALRNAAMRFGAALDLWHKGDLHMDEPIKLAPVIPALPKSDLPLDQMNYIADMAAKCQEFVSGGDAGAAHAYIEAEKLDNDQKIALWGYLDSKTRSAIKKAAK
jgi:hypothetical protein